jgi:hypothetical protein
MARARAAAVAALAALVAGCGSAHDRPPTSGMVQRALAARLEREGLSFRWVACVDSGRRRGGVPIFRCNVNFGEPHFEPYCAVLRRTVLTTQVEDPTLRCHRIRGGS